MEPFEITVDALALQRLLAYMEGEEHEDALDDDKELQDCVDGLAHALNLFALKNPEFDEA